MLWDQTGFLEALLEVSLLALSISDLSLEHAYYSFLGGIADGARVGGGILKTKLLAHDWKHAVWHLEELGLVGLCHVAEHYTNIIPVKVNDVKEVPLPPVLLDELGFHAVGFIGTLEGCPYIRLLWHISC